MSTPYLIPTVPQAQQLQITLGAVAYSLIFRWNVPNLSWMMDIADQDNNLILSGIPLVTGADLLSPFEYLEIGGSFDAGQLRAQTASNTFVPPTFVNLGTDGNLYWIEP